MKNPFMEKDNLNEFTIIKSAQEGNQKSLEKLIEMHQAWIYNISLKMVLNKHDAEDVTQEIIIKIITKLSTFKCKSSFRTWLYRIVSNHIINMKKSHCEKQIKNFSQYGLMNDKTTDLDLPDQKTLPVDVQILVEEAKIGCMTGMLLCLGREERLIFTLGEIFSVQDSLGSKIMKISRDNFRQKLSRARKKIYNFMNEKCGLINQENPCRCSRKTTAWIQGGLVDPNNLQFNTNCITKIRDVSEIKSKQLDNLQQTSYAELFIDHPFFNPPDFIKSIRAIIDNING